MDYRKIGNLIQKLRKEKQLTQKELADRLTISDKTISKWECGLGCPDVSLLGELSLILGVDMKKLLTGDLNPNSKDTGNLKNIRFYVCQDCGNVSYSTGNSDLSCCGRKLEELAVNENDLGDISIENDGYELYIHLNHPMEKQHYISFVAYVSMDKILFTKLYPEQTPELRVPYIGRGSVYVFCTQHGLYGRGILNG